MYIVHMCQNGHLATEEIVCGLNGEWETINGSSCVVNKKLPGVVTVIVMTYI